MIILPTNIDSFREFLDFHLLVQCMHWFCTCRPMLCNALVRTCTQLVPALFTIFTEFNLLNWKLTCLFKTGTFGFKLLKHMLVKYFKSMLIDTGRETLKNVLLTE